ncbi:hypothetical protein D0862_08110 [Hortaea werneckii]|uniref:F-box domain-containing protein n=1 Tax=Hortaea werneckii TaxID=91943 RepID=A0A3M7G9N6_HORWE|nr:hypothetical protein D0862_08110 [Hortaea werneckii]
MANFNSLPKAIRERIYELHLTQEEPISLKRYKDFVRDDLYTTDGRRMPALLQLSRRIEKEAAHFFYAKNDFEFSSLSDIPEFAALSWPRHRYLIRKVIVTWSGSNLAASGCFRGIASMRNVEELYIRVDEQYMLMRMLQKTNSHQTLVRNPRPSPQQTLSMLRHPGVAGLLKLRIPRVQFIKLAGRDKDKGGPIPGGVLETIVAPKIMSLKTAKEKGGFPLFFSLSPELRNRIYDLLLRLDGPIFPSPKEPNSASRNCRTLGTDRSSSVLNILAVNRQIHHEAVGIFYCQNAFIFHHILHLHGFIQRLGTLHLTFDLLKSLTGLRKLEIIMAYELVTRGEWHRHAGTPPLLKISNPCLLPGMKLLFELRGIANIIVRDDGVDYVHEMYQESSYSGLHPNKLRSAAKLVRIMKHFNTALQQAQTGRVNRALLEDKRWQMRDKFPELENDEAVTTENVVSK